jgi:hypothetical protein
MDEGTDQERSPGLSLKVLRYFFAVQTGQFAQSVLPSAQHCIPQDLLVAQPVAKAATQTIRARIRTIFMM